LLEATAVDDPPASGYDMFCSQSALVDSQGLLPGFGNKWKNTLFQRDPELFSSGCQDIGIQGYFGDDLVML
jgi:hypothetical protein